MGEVSDTKIFTEHEADSSAYGCVVAGSKVVILFDWAAEGMLHGVAVKQVKPVVDSESGRALPSELHAKITLIVVEVGTLLPQEIGDVSGEKGAVSVLTAIHEHSLFLGVSV